MESEFCGVGLNVLVTGALGHIGSALVRSKDFLNQCEEVYLLDDLSSQRYTSLFNLDSDACRFKFIEGRSDEAHERVDFGRLDYVVHLAAVTDAAGNAHRRDLVWSNNHDSTRSIVDVCHRFGVALVFPSSTSVYGSQASVVNEDCTDLQPQSPYAESKIAEESLIADAKASGLRACTLRLGTIFGVSPGMRFHTAVNRFCWQAATGQPLTVWSTALDQARPYLSVQDACLAIANCLESESSFNAPVINLVSENATVRNVIDAISDAGITPEVELVSSPIMNQLSYSVESLYAREAGFVFQGRLHEGVAETLRLLGGVRPGE